MNSYTFVEIESMKLNTSILAIIALLLSSCASIITPRKQKIYIEATTDSTMVCVNFDTSQVYYLPAIIEVERSARDLQYVVIKDTIQRKITLETRVSGRFWLGNLCLPIISHVIDLGAAKGKLYNYPRKVAVDLNDSTLLYPYSAVNRYCVPQKGVIRLLFGTPLGSYLFIPKGDNQVSQFGFNGFNLGFEYFTSKNRLFGLTIGRSATSDGIFGPRSTSSPVFTSDYYSFMYGYEWKKIKCKIGAQYSNIQRLEEYSQETVFSTMFMLSTKAATSTQSFGIASSVSLRIGKATFLGVNYYPSIMTISEGSSKLEYSNTLFFDLTFSPEISRPSKSKVQRDGNKKYTY